jgi:hypothetical protein
VRVIARDGSFDAELIVKAVLPGAGLMMEIDDTAVPRSPGRARLEAIEAQVHAEQEAAQRAKLNAQLGAAMKGIQP